MSNVYQLSDHPDYCPKFSTVVRDAMQKRYGLPLEVQRLGERLLNNPVFVRDVFGDGGDAA